MEHRGLCGAVYCQATVSVNEWKENAAGILKSQFFFLINACFIPSKKQTNERRKLLDGSSNDQLPKLRTSPTNQPSSDGLRRMLKRVAHMRGTPSGVCSETSSERGVLRFRAWRGLKPLGPNRIRRPGYSRARRNLRSPSALVRAHLHPDFGNRHLLGCICLCGEKNEKRHLQCELQERTSPQTSTCVDAADHTSFLKSNPTLCWLTSKSKK